MYLKAFNYAVSVVEKDGVLGIRGGAEQLF